MPAEIFPAIKKDFKSYAKFLKRKKLLESSIVTFLQEQYKRQYSGFSKIQTDSVYRACRLHGAVAMDDHKSYRLRIFAEIFGSGPCFRFCSSGRVHMNRDRGKGLPDLPIPTPHFHRVDKDGVMRAYQNALSDPKVREKIKDYQFGIKLFCQESNVVSPNGGSVAIKLTASEMDLSTDDPFGGIIFPT